MFHFKKFSVDDRLTAMKVGTDGVLLGAWGAGGERILDVGTGSGLIALMMAQRFGSAMVTAIDIDRDSCLQAKANVAESPYADRVEIRHVSLQELAQSEPAGAFDAILSNPPYFKNSLHSHDSKRNLARHADTLSMHDLVKCSKHLLAPRGTLCAICPESVKEELESESIIYGMTVRNSVELKTNISKAPSRVMVEIVNGYEPTRAHATEYLTEQDGSRSQWYQQLTKYFYIR